MPVSSSSKIVSPLNDCPAHPSRPSVAHEKQIIDAIARTLWAGGSVSGASTSVMKYMPSAAPDNTQNNDLTVLRRRRFRLLIVLARVSACLTASCAGSSVGSSGWLRSSLSKSDAAAFARHEEKPKRDKNALANADGRWFMKLAQSAARRKPKTPARSCSPALALPTIQTSQTSIHDDGRLGAALAAELRDRGKPCSYQAATR